MHAHASCATCLSTRARVCLCEHKAGSETSWLGSWLTRIGEESAGPRAICAARLHCPAATPPSVQCRCVRLCVGFARLVKPTQRAPSPLLPALAGSQGLHQLEVLSWASSKCLSFASFPSFVFAPVSKSASLVEVDSWSLCDELAGFVASASLSSSGSRPSAPLASDPPYI